MNKAFPTKTEIGTIMHVIEQVCETFKEGHILFHVSEDTDGPKEKVEVGYFNNDKFHIVYWTDHWSQALYKALMVDLKDGIILPHDFNEMEEWLHFVGYNFDEIDQKWGGKEWCDKYLASL